MLKYSLYKGTFELCFTLLILPLCHTVTGDNIRSQSVLDVSQNFPRSKREDPANKPITVEAINRTPTVADSNGTTEISVNKTIPPPHIGNGSMNFTLSLGPGFMDTIKSGALERTGLVVLGFMSIIVVFFIVRAIRLRHKKSKSRKYGIITSTEMEMEPLDNDEDDEEDTTLFDAQHKYSMP
ncbi:hypothetical protein JTE90_017012 [Oedothorax gibbosus]|uniref:Uncharacterized protein n=1 Tax=Oedothorax gibbosus TaxID=931172 RepID=A0AAV6UBU2_9ARAC|nr:hypothetical protein JTE90_017012 [Oedothorax gibbosus]